MTTWHLYYRDRSLSLAGEISEFSSFSAMAKLNDVGSWTLQMPADAALADVIEFGGGIVLFRDFTPVFSGPIARRLETVSANGDRLELSGPDDNWYLTTRVILPTPDGPPYTEAYAAYATLADQIMATLVDQQLSVSAKSERQLALLGIPPVSGLGADITTTARFDPLLDKLRSLAVEGGSLAFRMLFSWAPSAGAIAFRVWRPADRTSSVVFDRSRGNIHNATYEEILPAANYIYVLGPGEGQQRTISEGGSTTSITQYGVRIEKVVDARSAASTTELDQQRDAALQENSAIVRVSVNPVDIESFAFGSEYDLGDRVTAVVRNHRITGYITGARYDLDQSGGVVQPIIETEIRR